MARRQARCLLPLKQAQTQGPFYSLTLPAKVASGSSLCSDGGAAGRADGGDGHCGFAQLNLCMGRGCDEAVRQSVDQAPLAVGQAHPEP